MADQGAADTPLYREVQRFWSNRLLLVIGLGLVALAAVIAVSPGRIATYTPRGWTLVPLGLPLLLTVASLRTEVSSAGIVSVGFLPIRRGRRTIRIRDVTLTESVTYSPLREFGGYGWRIGAGGSRAYNVAGNRGVRLHLVGGTTVLIGSQRPGALAVAIESARPSRPSAPAAF